MTEASHEQWSKRRGQQRPNIVAAWLYGFLLVPTIVGCCVVCIIAVAYRFEGLCVSDCLDRVPYWRALIVSAFFAYLTKWLEMLWHKLAARPRS
jgi:hypothetical protein